jgi:hypothetical protein
MIQRVISCLGLTSRLFSNNLILTSPLIKVKQPTRHQLVQNNTFKFSNNSQKIRDILKSLKVQVNGK